jgi:hypothetical protein
MKFKVWCKQHDMALISYDGPPYCIPNDPQSGVWETDLSDMACPGEDVDDPDTSCAADWVVEVVDVLPA